MPRRIFLHVSAIYFALAILALPLPAQEQTDSEPDPELANELERDWQVAILPLIADDSEVLRTSPLIQTLPEVIKESLSILSERRLEEGEYSGYTESLVGRFSELDPSVVPEHRDIEIKIAEITSAVQKQLFFSELREHLQNETPFSSELIARLKEATGADLFIAGHIHVEDQYVFIDLLLISPYVFARDNTEAQVAPQVAEVLRVPVLQHILFSLRTIEVLDEMRRYISRDLGQQLYNVPAGSLEISSSGETVRVYIDEEYRGTAPLFAAPLKAGPHLLELYSGTELLFANNLLIEENETVMFTVPRERKIQPQLAFNTVPSGLAVHEGSSFLGYTPLLINRPEDTIYIQVSGEDVRQSYVKIDQNTSDYISTTLPGSELNLKEQLTLDREQFYLSLGFTLLTALIPLFMEGINQDIGETNTTGFTVERIQTLRNELSIARSGTIAGLGITIIGLINTVSELFDYLLTAEMSRSVIIP